jgi:RNA polymerase sigma factor (sigma-70 family)
MSVSGSSPASQTSGARCSYCEMPDGEAVVLRGTVARDAGFDAFYGAEHVRLFHALFLLTWSREDAEDVSHEAFVRVLERWERIRDMASPRAYLYRTALNLHRNGLRRRWRWTRLVLSERGVERDASEAAIARADVLRALEAVSREQREVLVLVDFLDLSAGEVAAVLGIDPDAVRARVHRGRARMREELSEYG